MENFSNIEDRKRLFVQLILDGRCVSTACFIRGTDRTVAELESFVVWNEDERRQGYGTKVMNEACRILPSYGIKQIYVDSVFPQALKFYLNYGFQIIGSHSDGPPLRVKLQYQLRDETK